MSARELIERLEKLDGPDRLVDFQIDRRLANLPMEYDVFWTSHDAIRWRDGTTTQGAKPYTRSLDVAIALVEKVDPEHCYRVEKLPPSNRSAGPAWATCGLPSQQEQAYGPTPAIALLIALLRSLSPTEGE